MEPFAEASCVLKVDVHCQACKMRMLEVLGSICGAFNVDINSEEGLARVYGMVDPNILMKALTRSGYHAELKWVKLRQPDPYYLNGSNCYNSYYDPYGYGSIDHYLIPPSPFSYASQYYHRSTHHYYGPQLRSSYPYFRRPGPFSF